MASAAWVGIALPGLSLAATLNVPADYPTIQACIDAVASGIDECVVAPGTYHETINFFGKAITLRSSGGADVTTIDATGIGGSVVTCANSEGPDTVLDGFTITGGTGTDFYGNGYTWGGGMFNYQSSPTVDYCTFRRNAVTYAGGGMINYVGYPTVGNCTFSDNIARVGGGMSNYYANTMVVYCTFRGNKVVAAGGGMYNQHSSPRVANCAFIGNTADSGGGILSIGASDPTVSNSTFGGNTALNGGGVYHAAGSNHSLTMTGCVLWGNAPDEIEFRPFGLYMLFNDMKGGLPADAVDGGGNINLDPMFVRPPDPGPDGNWDGVDDDYGDLRLQAGSPCIDAGDPGFVAQPGETDLEGHARVLCEYVDMGAYEFGIGDYDCDQTVDLTDFASWSACMTGPQGGPYDVGCEAFDFNADGDVDFGDFSVMQCLIVP